MALFHHASAWACDPQFFLFISSLIWLWWVLFTGAVTIVQHCKGDCFAPSLEQTTLKCHIHLQIIWEKAWLLWVKVWKIQVNSLPSSHFFAQLLEMVIGENSKPFSQLQFNAQHCCLSACTPRTVEQGDMAELSLDATSALHRGFLSSYRYTQDSSWSQPEGPQNTTAENSFQFPKTQLQRIHPNSPLEARKG